MAKGNIQYLPLFNFKLIKNRTVLKEYLANSSAYSILYRLRRLPLIVHETILWLTGKQSDRPSQRLKQRIIKDYARRNDLDIFIETGTYMGDTLAAVANSFKKVHSIELSEDLYTKAVKRFANNESVAIHYGDSLDVLPNILSGLEEPALFWLDGHYSGNITVRGKYETPVRFELEAILQHPVKNHVVLIDDARCFDGSHDYPTMEELKSLVSRFRPGSEFAVASDIIRIVLK